MFKNIKKFCNDLNDINNMGFVFKVSDDIVYARGLLKVQMSEMVKFELENESLFGIVNYLDNEGVAGITVLGDATNITAQTVVVRTYKQPTIGTGYNVLSRVVNSIGEAIDEMK
jgi:F-type H+-transporting ATPase subunit alpha